MVADSVVAAAVEGGWMLGTVGLDRGRVVGIKVVGVAVLEGGVGLVRGAVLNGLVEGGAVLGAAVEGGAVLGGYVVGGSVGGGEEAGGRAVAGGMGVMTGISVRPGMAGGIEVQYPGGALAHPGGATDSVTGGGSAKEEADETRQQIATTHRNARILLFA